MRSDCTVSSGSTLARPSPASSPRASVMASTRSVLARSPRLAAHETVCRGLSYQHRVARARERLVERLPQGSRGLQPHQDARRLGCPRPQPRQELSMSLARRRDPRRWQLHLARRGADGADHVCLLRDIDPHDAAVRSSILRFHGPSSCTRGNARLFGPVARPLLVAGSAPGLRELVTLRIGAHTTRRSRSPIDPRARRQGRDSPGVGRAEMPIDDPFPASSARSHLTCPIYKAQTVRPGAHPRWIGPMNLPARLLSCPEGKRQLVAPSRLEHKRHPLPIGGGICSRRLPGGHRVAQADPARHRLLKRAQAHSPVLPATPRLPVSLWRYPLPRSAWRAPPCSSSRRRRLSQPWPVRSAYHLVCGLQ